MRHVLVLALALFALVAEAPAIDQTEKALGTSESSIELRGAVGTRLEALETATPTFSLKCCKVCKKGKACGDSCISKKKRCTKGKGCACDAPGDTLNTPLDSEWILGADYIQPDGNCGVSSGVVQE